MSVLITDLFGPPPSGLDLSEDQSSKLITPVIVVLVFAVATVTLRVIARVTTKSQKMEADDILILFGLLFAFGNAATVFASLYYDCGKHIWALTLDQFGHIQKVVYATALIYTVSVTFTKTSIILYYRRIFGFRIVFYIAMFLITAYFITLFVVMNTGCQPTAYLWEQWTHPEKKGKCIPLLDFYLGNGIVAALIDIFILLTPVYPVYKLQMRASKKFAVIGIFLLGAVSVGASIGRIISLHKLATMRDQSWGIASGIYWTCIEPCVGIISACLPTLGPLIRRWGGKFSSHFTNGYDNGTDDRSPVPHSRPQQVPGLNPSYSDEYELRNEITETGRKTNSVRTSEDLEMAGIIVTQEISFTRK